MRRLITTLLVLGLLLVVADRGGAVLAGRAVAAELQMSAGLAVAPDIEVMGVPFLTQAVAGRYEQVQVRARQVPAGEVRLAELDATLYGVGAPLGQVVTGRLDEVSVDRLEAVALLDYETLARRSGERALTVTPAGDRVRVEGSVEVIGRTLRAAALSTVTLEGQEVVVTAQDFQVGSEAADRVVTRALSGRFDLRVPTGGLPYGLAIESVDVEPTGVRLRAAARDVVVAPP